MSIRGVICVHGAVAQIGEKCGLMLGLKLVMSDDI